MVGARKMPREFMKLNRELALCKIFHGTIAQPPMMVMKMAPRRILNHFGNRFDRSFAPEMTVADMLTQIWAMTQELPAKNAAARPPGPSHESMMTMGSQTYSL